jgi:signal transduction histidine kinase/AraC-like DNA-binding protein
MATIVRLGVQVPPADPFWVQMREAIVQYAQAMRIDVISFDLETLALENIEQETTALELIQALELDTIISHLLPASLLRRVLKADIPVIYLNEHSLRHPRFVTTVGLHESARIAVRYLAEQLQYHGNALLVGEFETGRSRLAGACGVLQAFPRIVQYRQPCPWNYLGASATLSDDMQRIDAPLDAIFGFSDGLALVARDVGRTLGIVGDDTVVVGIDGDPLAIAAIAEGSMAATVELAPIELGRQAVELAYQAARRLPLPRHCRYQPRLVTRQNVAEVAAKKLIAMAHMPSHLVGVNRHQEQQQLAQLEASQLINRQATAILDRAALVREIVELIRAHFGYDQVYLLRWSHQDAALAYDQQAHGSQFGSAMVGASGVLTQAIGRNEVIFVPDMHHSQRFAPDPAWPATVSRVVVPIHVGASIVGLLDLHSLASRPHTRQELSGLQSLADQLGTALRNAELYEEALAARAAAERADTLKTRLLANVSHELRTPLNVILGYTQTILTQPQIYAEQLPTSLLNDVRHVYQSGEHLIRLINDLLDLSRAEIGVLDIFPELLDPRILIEEAFESMAARQPAGGAVRWQLDLPAQLPLLEADPVRVRQIVFNLLSNAAKFTTQGQITVGACVEPPCLRIWVADTGGGIPRELHERIFEPFVTGEQPGGAREGIGLGLSIVRQLVGLHGGTMRLESQPGHGSVFHVALPLPRIHAHAPGAHLPRPPAVLLVATSADDQVLAGLCRRQELLPYHVAADEQLDRLFTAVQPVALVCDVDQARAHDWSLIEQIRLHPQGCMVPLLLYNPLETATDGTWLTRVLIKPFRSTQLLDMVMAACSEAGVRSVLIVDDDPESCAFYQQLVASVLPAASLRVAHDGAAALALLAHEVPSLLILDLVMPGVDGFAVLQHLRADARTRNLPVMVLSGKLLSPEDLRRLTYHQVVYQSKDLLTADELAGQIRRANRGALTRSPQTSRLVKHAVAYLQTHHQRPISRQEIADSLGINQTYLSEIFQQELGLTPWDYLNRYRIKQAKSLLRDGSRSVTEVADSVGFNDPSYFGRVFRRIVGCSPQAYRGRPLSGE